MSSGATEALPELTHHESTVDGCGALRGRLRGVLPVAAEDDPGYIILDGGEPICIDDFFNGPESDR